ncbi:membrane protein insertase YidC [uncultured Desulfovibrio sp.]|uniref:membrane protein insertase YidC n=1 Tax=uncultured Desulfovibrio sp. TaxID=167968 RepID=UPI001C39C59A|nr:membrane protein insertase YidC [uncultured Desulfovibrio sp.]HIX40293.1 membrane protein insertase YidC [Candidatus Desulfovibrio intestinigallinarum]
MQDSKNLVIAIVLCLLILVGWSALSERMGWISKPDPAVIAQQQEQARKEAEAEKARKMASATTPDGKPLPAFTPAPGKEVTIKTPLYTAVFHTGGGIVRSFSLNHYRSGVAADSPAINMVDATTANFSPLGLVVNKQPSWSNGVWSYEGADSYDVAEGKSVTLKFTGEVDKIRLVRELTFSGDSYLVKERVRLATPEETSRSVRLEFTVASDSRFAAGGNYDAMRVAWDNDGSLAEESSVEKLAAVVTQRGRIYWAGPTSTYFLMAIMPAVSDNVGLRAWTQEAVFRASLEPQEVVVEPGKESVCDVSYWIGPKERARLLAVSEELAKSVDLGMFSLIGKGLLWLLAKFYSFVGNWGVAIILLTVLIKAVFWPLTAKSYASMEQMRRLKPQMDEIRERCKDDKQAMNKEVMALYKTYGVNPASGCIPLLIQLPVFFGLYQALLTSIELRHASFITYLPGTDMLWLADLSSKDPYYITPIIMGVTMFIQQRFNPPASDPTQQKIMMALPFVFTILFLGFPSGLVIYWLVNNILSILQQWMMSRKQRLDK